MDSSLYKTRSVPRDLTYNYFFSPAVEGKSTFLFVHGFPASSSDWTKQVEHFKAKGYGIIAPDLLGSSGKTSHPQNIAAFCMSDMAADIISILDAENVDKVIGVCHDWGSGLLSRLVLIHPDRFIGSVWVGMVFALPNQERFDIPTVMRITKEMFGYEGVAYWEYFVKENSPKEICKNIESFMQLCYAQDPSVWRQNLVVPGKTEEWVQNDTRVGRPGYLTDAEFEQICANFVEAEGSSLCWYKCHISDLNLEENRRLKGEGFTLKHPTLLICAAKDIVCPPAFSKMGMQPFGTDLTVDELQTGHWVHLERPQEVNEIISKWLESKNL